MKESPKGNMSMREKSSNFLEMSTGHLDPGLIIMAVESMMENHMSVGEWLLYQSLILPGIIIGLSFSRSGARACFV